LSRCRLLLQAKLLVDLLQTWIITGENTLILRILDELIEDFLQSFAGVGLPTLTKSLTHH